MQRVPRRNTGSLAKFGTVVNHSPDCRKRGSICSSSADTIQMSIYNPILVGDIGGTIISIVLKNILPIPLVHPPTPRVFKAGGLFTFAFTGRQLIGMALTLSD